ncbi:phosphotransferase [Microdochium nivale]|nr:phosphotransferase [Microdochium nivale]
MAPEASNAGQGWKANQRNSSHGPFSQPREWNLARLDIACAQIEEQVRWMQFTPSGRRQNRLTGGADARQTSQSNMEVAKRMLKTIQRLCKLQDVFWPAAAHGSDGKSSRVRLPASTFLWHDNLSADNLLVDDNGVLRGVLDWADISCLPRHAACEMPAVLQQQRSVHQDPALPPSLGGRGRHLIRAYYAEKRRYETTAMQELFLARMRELSPVWTRAYEGGELLRDMEAAVQNCDSEDAFELVEQWVAGIDGGKTPGKDMEWLHRALWPV